jgi:hypothetical protein
MDGVDMMQSFQCIVCGHQNAFGEPACAQCGQAFIYNCPICGSHINNRYDKCRACGASFIWGTTLQQNHPDSVLNIPPAENQSFQNMMPQNAAPYIPPPAQSQPGYYPNPAVSTARKTPQPVQSQNKSLFSSPRLWIILIIICAVLIAIMFIIDRLISK